MTLPDLQWIVGIAVTAVLAIAGIAISSFRAMSGRLDKSMETLTKTVKEGDDVLHERLNRIREDVSNNYVRRVDLDSHMKRVDETLKEVRDDQKQIMRQL